ncbi:MAG: hypothetical protein JJ855_03555 [Rhodospirillales bacterium]|nr:hypothetical protein [Rhodospirillales bacterium]
MNSDARLVAALHRAVGLENDGDFFGAEQLYRQLTSRPRRVAHADYQYAQFLLRRGDYAEAWPHYMKRLDDLEYASRATYQLKQPYMTSAAPEAVSGKTILVYCDQGIGDAIMCARYVPELAVRAGRVVVVVFEGFRDFFSCLGDIENVRVLEFGDSLPSFDMHADMLSLPAVFDTRIQDIPPSAWLKADPDWCAYWRKLLPKNDLRIGLTWQGNPSQTRDPERSAKLADFWPLLETGHTFVNLQAGHGVDQLDDPNVPCEIVRFPEITASINGSTKRMVDCAALIACLDLVITVDTAIAHVAGALGKPVWMLTAKVPYWVYMQEGDRTPWYSTMRLFRTQQRYDWRGPVSEMKALLSREDPLRAALT